MTSSVPAPASGKRTVRVFRDALPTWRRSSSKNHERPQRVTPRRRDRDGLSHVGDGGRTQTCTCTATRRDDECARHARELRREVSQRHDPGQWVLFSSRMMLAQHARLHCSDSTPAPLRRAVYSPRRRVPATTCPSATDGAPIPVAGTGAPSIFLPIDSMGSLMNACSLDASFAPMRTRARVQLPLRRCCSPHQHVGDPT